MDNQEKSLRDQLDTTVVDARNEAISQAAGAFEFGHRVVRTSLGAVVLGIEEAQALLQSATERGEKAEADMQQMMDDLRRRMTDAAETMRSEAWVRTSEAVSSGLASLLNKLPVVSITYKAPSDAPAVSGSSTAVDSTAALNGEMDEEPVAKP